MTIVTLNAQCGLRFDQLCAAFRTHSILQSADIVFLQEIEHWPGEEWSQAEILAGLLGKHVAYAAARPLPKAGSHGIAILSAFPIIKSETLSLPYYHSYLNPRTRIAQFCDILVNNNPVTLVNVHLDLKINMSDRIAQTTPILDKIDTLGAAKIILAGDFNTTLFKWFKNTIPVGFARQHTQLRSLGEARGFTAVVPRKPTTMRVGPLGMVLDHIFVKGLTTRLAQVETGLRVSDHYPVWATLAFA